MTVSPDKQRDETVRRRFRRFLVAYAAFTAAGVATAFVVLGRGPSLDWHLAIVYMLYWLALVPIVRFALDARRLWKKTLFAIALGLVLLVGGLELIGQFIVGERRMPSMSECSVAHRRLHHVLLPDSRMVWQPGAAAESQIFVETNEDALRTPWSRPQFLKAGYRVAVLGDSYAFGFFVPYEQSIPAVLEQKLRARRMDLDVRVLNAGHISWSPLIERQVFDDIVRHYRPHLTLMTLNLSDIGDDYKHGMENTSTGPDLHFPFPDEYLVPASRPWEESPTRQLLRLTRIGEPVQRLLGDAPAKPAEPGRRYDYYRFEIKIGDVVENDLFFPLRHPMEAMRPHYERTFAHIRRTRDACRDAGSDFALVLMPFNFHWNNRESPQDVGRLAGQYTGNEPHRFTFFEFFEEAGEKADMTVINLLDAFQATTEYPLCFEEDAHYNAAGNRLAAGAIAQYLLDSNRLPPPSR